MEVLCVIYAPLVCSSEPINGRTCVKSRYQGIDFWTVEFKKITLNITIGMWAWLDEPVSEIDKRAPPCVDFKESGTKARILRNVWRRCTISAFQTNHSMAGPCYLLRKIQTKSSRSVSRHGGINSLSAWKWTCL
ncbi:unnamed protein product [Nesidiocoris tenuis]|uniref:Uncharacterized protein n=1 Tax=Nesidiocoris tenuis TaxID=355587 RepID=A0A6H5HFG0_9HEMI|nr:unnamed protein product [Nesidiocoris tenuis]